MICTERNEYGNPIVACYNWQLCIWHPVHEFDLDKIGLLLRLVHFMDNLYFLQSSNKSTI